MTQNNLVDDFLSPFDSRTKEEAMAILLEYANIAVYRAVTAGETKEFHSRLETIHEGFGVLMVLSHSTEKS